MADRLVASPNTEEDDEFLTNIDETCQQDADNESTRDCADEGAERTLKKTMI
jgi:hypothetical protein